MRPCPASVPAVAAGLVATLFLMDLRQATAAECLALVQDGRPLASIAVLGDAAAAREALDEFNDTLRRATGATLPVTDREQAGVWLVTKEGLAESGLEAPGLSPQGFRIRCDGRRLVIAGGGRDGLYYGVCAFLEQALRVRWLWPGPSGEVVPRQRTLAVPAMDLAERPDFLWRDLGPGGPLYHAEDRWQAERRLGTSAATQEAVRRWARRNRMGGLRIADGHAWGRIVAPEKFAASHPEYFALVRGKRASGPWDGKHGYQLCTTNPEVIKRVVQYCRDRFDRHPELGAVSISPNDGLGFCECANCAALDVAPPAGAAAGISDRIFTFAAAVAGEVKKTHPDKLLLMLVYSLYQEPPRRVSVPDNLILQYCVQSFAFGKPTTRDMYLSRVRTLGQISRQVGIYEYFILGAWPDLPRLFGPYIQDSIRAFHQAGARYYSTQAGNGFAVNGWNYYLAARLLWNVKREHREVLDDYCRSGFGAAAGSVRKYLESVQGHWLRTGGASAGRSVYQQVDALFPPGLLAEWAGLLDQARRESDSPEVAARVAFLRDGLHYVELVVEADRRTAAMERAGLPVSRDSAGAATAAAKLRREGRWAAIEPLARAAVQAWSLRDQFLEAHRDDVLVSHLWIRYNDWERGGHPGKFLAAALAAPTETKETPEHPEQVSIEDRYNAYLRRRIEERPGPRLRPGFPADRQQWLAFSHECRQRLRVVFDFPAHDCPLAPRVVGRRDYGDYVLERVVYYAEPFSAVPAHVYLPKTAHGPAPALIFASGHGGSKSKFYNQYAGQLYARAGVVCLIPDPPGEEERDEQCRMGVRGHRLDFRIDRGLAVRRQEIGKFVYDLVRGVDYLCSRPEVDKDRIGATGHSLGGTLTMYLTAVDQRIRLSMPSAWTGHFGSIVGGLSCCWRPVGLLHAGDQPELVALGAPHCATCLLEGEVDYTPAYHEGRQRTYREALEVYRLFGRQQCLRLQIEPAAGHRPYFLTPEALAWVMRHFGPLRWTPEQALALPVVKIAAWAGKVGAPLEKSYAGERDHGGTRAVDIDAKYHAPEQLRVLSDAQWQRAPYSLASWMAEVEKGLPPVEPAPTDRAAWETRRKQLRTALAQCLAGSEPAPLRARAGRSSEFPGGRAEGMVLGAIGLGALLLVPAEPAAEMEAVILLDASRSCDAARHSAAAAECLRKGKIVLALDCVGLNDSAYLLGESPTAHNIARVREAIDYLGSRRDLGIKHIACHSEVDDVGLLAAILDERIESLTVGGRSGEKCKKQGYRREGTVPGLARIAARETLLALIAPRPLRLALADEPSNLAGKTYQLYGAGPNLTR